MTQVRELRLPNTNTTANMGSASLQFIGNATILFRYAALRCSHTLLVPTKVS